jgi:hypothetical protein
MKKQMDTFVHVNGNDRLEEMRRFIAEHDLTEVPPNVYHLIESLWPDLVHKVIPPRELMH